MGTSVGPFGTTYTVFLRGFESIGSQSGLSLTNAFRRVLSLAGRSHEFERVGEDWVLRISGRTTPVGAAVLRSNAAIEPDAKRDLMFQAIDGHLSGFAAVPDDAFPEIRVAAARKRHGS
jgi:hypothetical protein